MPGAPGSALGDAPEAVFWGAWRVAAASLPSLSLPGGRGGWQPLRSHRKLFSRVSFPGEELVAAATPVLVSVLLRAGLVSLRRAGLVPVLRAVSL